MKIENPQSISTTRLDLETEHCKAGGNRADREQTAFRASFLLSSRGHKASTTKRLPPQSESKARNLDSDHVVSINRAAALNQSEWNGHDGWDMTVRRTDRCGWLSNRGRTSLRLCGMRWAIAQYLCMATGNYAGSHSAKNKSCQIRTDLLQQQPKLCTQAMLSIALYSSSCQTIQKSLENLS